MEKILCFLLGSILVTDKPTHFLIQFVLQYTQQMQERGMPVTESELSTLKHCSDLDYIPTRSPRDGSKLKEPRLNGWTRCVPVGCVLRILRRGDRTKVYKTHSWEN